MLIYERGVDLVPCLPLAERKQMLAASASPFQGTHNLYAARVGDGLNASDAFFGYVVEDRAPLLN